MKERSLDTSLKVLAFYDHDGCCWKMSQDTLLSEEPALLERLPDWGTTTVAGELCKRQMPERLTNVRDSLSGRKLPTPAARDYKDYGLNVNWERGKNRSILPGTLMSLVYEDGKE